jgi:hypothetical protein
MASGMQDSLKVMSWSRTLSVAPDAIRNRDKRLFGPLSQPH